MSNFTRESFVSVLSPELCSNPDAFLTLVRGGIYNSPSPLAAANRFRLQSITIHKKLVLSQHECSSACFKDLEKPSENLLLFIERNASTTPSPLANNKSTLETIKQTLGQANSTVFSSISSTTLNSLENHTTRSPPTPSSADSLIPLLPMNPSDESSELGRSSFAVTPTASNQPGHSILQRVTLASTQGLRVIHDSIAEVYEAEDRVLGTAFCHNSKGSYGHGRVVREVYLPDDTTFMVLDLAILINVIHIVAPIYSLFENHCYWFVKILSDSIVAIAGANCVDRDADRDIDNELYRQPSNRPVLPSSYLPALCGTWNGILVSQVKDGVLATVLSEFSKQRAEEMAEIQRRQEIIDGHVRSEVELKELRREVVERDEELESLRSGMSTVQSELVTLRHKLRVLESNHDSSPPSEMLQSFGFQIQ